MEERKTIIPDGEHEHTYDNGCHYRGNWLGNRRQGYGVSTWLSGAKYEGQYFNDNRHG